MDRASIVILAAGKSTRYGGNRPKYLRTLPDGELVIQSVIREVSSRSFSRIILVVQEAHLDGIDLDAICSDVDERVEILRLNGFTQGPAITASMAVELLNIEGPVSFRDCDSLFSVEASAEGSGYVAITDCRQANVQDLVQKSFVLIDENTNLVLDIVEKSPVSYYVSVGEYGFGDARRFLSETEHLMRLSEEKELYLSHVMSRMLASGECFRGLSVDMVVDLGTEDRFQEYISRRASYFCDIDGVLVLNQSKYFDPKWDIPPTPIQQNVDALLSKQDEGAELVFVTSRPESLRPQTQTALQEMGFYSFQLIMGLRHARRILVNDYADSNPYPSGIAVNIKRNTNNLGELI